MLWSTALMLEHLGAAAASTELMAAIEQTLRTPATRTADIGGVATTDEVTAAVLDLVS